MHGFLVVDKEAGWTSHDVCAKMRGVLKEKKIGHLGTLDPLATGVLVLAVGKEATREVQNFMGLDKEYEVEMEIGKKSDTYDKEGKIVDTNADLDSVSDEKILDVIESFWGESEQMPPSFSAKKVNGKKAYELARRGIKPELKPKMVSMQGGDIYIKKPFIRFNVTVSSGTYVRSLVHDIGEKLGTGAILTSLRRLRVGPFDLSQAKSIEELALSSKIDLLWPPSSLL